MDVGPWGGQIGCYHCSIGGTGGIAAAQGALGGIAAAQGALGGIAAAQGALGGIAAGRTFAVSAAFSADCSATA